MTSLCLELGFLGCLKYKGVKGVKGFKGLPCAGGGGVLPAELNLPCEVVYGIAFLSLFLQNKSGSI